MTIRSRGEIAFPMDIVQLRALFKGPDGNPADLDSFPQISIVQPNGNVALGPTSAGVYHLSTGLYGFDYTIPYNAYFGVQSDVWSGTLSGFTVSGTLNFIVENSQMPKLNTDGYLSLGDDVGFNYTQAEIANINKLIKAVKARLNSSGKARLKDQYGNVIYQDCDIYTVEQLVVFIADALTAFNQIPHFTMFTFSDTEFISQFFEVLVQHAVIYALSSKALIERGREFNLSDNGLTFQPPTVSDMLSTQWSGELNNWFEKVKLIKASMKPGPLGLGTLRVTGAAPQVMRLRHLRARQIL